MSRVKVPEDISNQESTSRGKTASTFGKGPRQVPALKPGEGKGGDPFTGSTTAHVRKDNWAVKSGQVGSGD